MYLVKLEKSKKIKVGIVLEWSWFQNNVYTKFRGKIFLLMYTFLKESDYRCNIVN